MGVSTSHVCPAENASEVDQSSFWSSGNLHWDQHRIGWAISGGCALLTIIISVYSILQHARNYHVRNEQRQIIRILYLPPVYAIISFLSYRFFRSYTYYNFAEVAYEAVTVSAFLLLLIEYVAATSSDHTVESSLQRKDKKPLPIPFCCWRYRPTKAYFMYTIKWSVMQYVVIHPAISVAGIICEALGVLCDAGPYDPFFAKAYLEALDFISISIALYGLILFYGLTKEELRGRRPLAKFLAIKLIVAATFYQSVVFSMLAGNVIPATEYWSATNIANGLNALTICIEMVGFALFMLWAYTPSEYKLKGEHTSIWKPLWDSINFSDFVIEIFGSLRYFATSAFSRKNLSSGPDYSFNVPGSATIGSMAPPAARTKATFEQAFGVRGQYIRPGVGAGVETDGLGQRQRVAADSRVDVMPMDSYSGSDEWRDGP